MIPEVSNAECVVDLSLLLSAAFSTDKLFKIAFKVLPQHVNFWMYFGFPVRVDVVNVWDVNLLAPQLSYDTCTMIRVSWQCIICGR